jgi:hypothetical protein
MNRCYCPNDCNCHYPWRTNYCGCKQHPTATVLVDGEEITGTVYNVRDNGWPCVQTPEGRIASGPKVANPPVPRYVRPLLASHWPKPYRDRDQT